ncbi:uncharacterized protein LACBIDRAFT_303124 [Laccaria bicolor S238N-H82]|uniref:Predicted protein n=1 Tax=Laccaria bicolor (strain S238N-H82 / ATCC MYA-4686) TaxID=486041 RepID=B0DIZ4_LACBS|nr:uncharacterized protein LACBIDRAFT_303124 [Laccaria bicolor S238N-H82]EDR05430.1 predicted protein [Laccaria bicolor S238N-H82]|eukprot:XP_001883988.1 predicted protein [Laccaria bicolor S238N-H82]
MMKTALRDFLSDRLVTVCVTIHGNRCRSSLLLTHTAHNFSLCDAFSDLKQHIHCVLVLG